MVAHFNINALQQPENITLLPSGAADVSRLARGHWGIENKSHYVRDTVYREDNSQAWAEEGPQAMAQCHGV